MKKTGADLQSEDREVVYRGTMNQFVFLMRGLWWRSFDHRWVACVAFYNDLLDTDSTCATMATLLLMPKLNQPL